MEGQGEGNYEVEVEVEREGRRWTDRISETYFVEEKEGSLGLSRRAEVVVRAALVVSALEVTGCSESGWEGMASGNMGARSEVIDVATAEELDGSSHDAPTWFCEREREREEERRGEREGEREREEKIENHTVHTCVHTHVAKTMSTNSPLTGHHLFPP